MGIGIVRMLYYFGIYRRFCAGRGFRKTGCFEGKMVEMWGFWMIGRLIKDHKSYLGFLKEDNNF